MMTQNLAETIADAAARAVAMCEARGKGPADYSEASLAVIEWMLDDAADIAP